MRLGARDGLGPSLRCEHPASAGASMAAWTLVLVFP